MKGGRERADGLVHQFRQLLRRFSGQSNFEQICSIKIGPKNWPRKAGEQWGLRPQGFDASGKLRAASLALRWEHHQQPAAAFFFGSAALASSRVGMYGQQPTRCPVLGGCGCCCCEGPRLSAGGRSDQPEGAVALVRANRGAGAVEGHRCGHTWCRQGECAHNFGSQLAFKPLSSSNLLLIALISLLFSIKNSLLYL